MRFSPRQQAVGSIAAIVLASITYVLWTQSGRTTASTSAPDITSGSAAGSLEERSSQPAHPDHAPAATSPWLTAEQASAVAPSGPLPATLELALLNASLSALQSNGANLSAPMRSRHVVQVTDPRTADELMRWGRQQGFSMSFDRFYLHGGIEAKMLFFDKHIVPNAQRIQQDGLAILSALTGMDTAEYGTWIGEINRS